MAAAADNNANNGFLGLNEDEERHLKNMTMRALVATATYPLTCCKTLIQLGHEPFPLSTGKTFIVAGRNAYFLPNLFSYANQLRKAEGWRVLFTGVDAGVSALCVQGIVTYKVVKYLDKYYEEVGGQKINEEAEERDLDDHQSFQRKFRAFIRDSIVRIVAVTVSRPLTVVMVRQIAQLIGRETKYTTLTQALRVIGVEEGPAGLFSGLVPQIVGEITVIAGIHALSYFCERAIYHAGMYENQDERSQKFRLLHRIVDTVMAIFSPIWEWEMALHWGGEGQDNIDGVVDWIRFRAGFLGWHFNWEFLKEHEYQLQQVKIMLKERITPEEVKDVRKFCDMAVPFCLQSYGYPYSVVSTIMAVAGSGLAVSFLPYTPSFLNWQTAYDYLRPHGLKRGARMFLREQTGAVSVGVDQQLYASNKHFA